ncbi:SCO family protein [Palleronia marisminoris]|uniref:SCO family protein n=1 Tax=Palleronia marisminoris TaxID=315423 RepID=UPI001C311DCB|nr:SCO family protein [Palleronia marisminoris]
MPLLTQDGETVNFYDDLIDGRIVVVNFVYTDCPDICGLSTARLAQVVDWLGDRVGRDIFVYSISLDPETDTPSRLKAYAAAFGAPSGWTFLTGTRENIDQVRFKLGERSESLSDHRSDMVIGNAATGEWRRTSLMGSLVVATTDVLELDPAWTPPPQQALLDHAPMTVTDEKGESLFITGCAACHTIGRGVRVGPDLAGVTLRRERGWLETYLADPSLMLDRGDPVAVELDTSFPDVRMPDLGLGTEDIADLLHYLESQTSRLGSPLSDVESAAHDHAGHHGHSEDQAHDHEHEHEHDHGSPASGEDRDARVTPDGHGHTHHAGAGAAATN